MKVYQPGTRGRRTVLAQPGKEFPVSHFLDANGVPQMFSITFIEGEAEVEDRLAEYLIDKGMAAKSPILIPQGVAA